MPITTTCERCGKDITGLKDTRISSKKSTIYLCEGCKQAVNAVINQRPKGQQGAAHAPGAPGTPTKFNINFINREALNIIKYGGGGLLAAIFIGMFLKVIFKSKLINLVFWFIVASIAIIATYLYLKIKKPGIFKKQQYKKPEIFDVRK